MAVKTAYGEIHVALIDLSIDVIIQVVLSLICIPQTKNY